MPSGEIAECDNSPLGQYKKWSNFMFRTGGKTCSYLQPLNNQCMRFQHHFKTPFLKSLITHKHFLLALLFDLLYYNFNIPFKNTQTNTSLLVFSSYFAFCNKTTTIDQFTVAMSTKLYNHFWDLFGYKNRSQGEICVRLYGSAKTCLRLKTKGPIWSKFQVSRTAKQTEFVGFFFKYQILYSC